MKVKFWGVRGSIPTPLSNESIRNKISAAVQRIEPKDLVSPESRERFLSGLPEYLFGTVGGNTTCVEAGLSDGTTIIFDAGSGLRELGGLLRKRGIHGRDYHFFMTHFHWDHLQGLPFFAPLSDGNTRLFFHSPDENAEKYIRAQMRFPYFPVTLDVMPAELQFVVLRESHYRVRDALISWRNMNHPGGCTSYRLEADGKTTIFSTDTELSQEDFKKTPENTAFYKNADLLIMDAQYTLEESFEKFDWGHSSYSLAVDFAAVWGIRRLALFHHEPLYDDKKMHGITKSARWYGSRLNGAKVDIILAREGLELTV